MAESFKRRIENKFSSPSDAEDLFVELKVKTDMQGILMTKKSAPLFLSDVWAMAKAHCETLTLKDDQPKVDLRGPFLAEEREKSRKL